MEHALSSRLSHLGQWPTQSSRLQMYALVVVGYWAMERLAVWLAASSPGVPVIALHAGVAVAALLLLGLRAWRAVFVAALLASWDSSLPASMALLEAGSRTLEACLCAYFLLRQRWSPRGLETLRGVMVFGIRGAFLGSLVAVVAIYGFAALAGEIPARHGALAGVEALAADVAGILVVTPVLLLYLSRRAWRHVRVPSAERLAVAAAVAVLMLAFWFGLLHTRAQYTAFCLFLFPLLFWVACRYGTRGAAVANLVLALTTTGMANAMHLLGASTIGASGLPILAFIAAASLTSLLAAGALTQRRRFATALARSKARYRAVIEASPDAILLATTERGCLSSSNGLLRLWGLEAPAGSVSSLATLRRWVRDRVISPDSVVDWLEGVAQDQERSDRREIDLKDGRAIECCTAPVRYRNGTSGGRVWHVRDISERKQIEAQILDSRAKLRTLYRRMGEARDEQRVQLAREVHDQLGQMVTTLKLDLNWLLRSSTRDPAQVRDRLQEMAYVTDQMLETVQEISARLRPAMLDDLGLDAAIETYGRDFAKRTGIDNFALNLRFGSERLGRPLAMGVFRILQEALTNVARHAGASTVEVTTRRLHDKLFLRVRDNGVGIPPDAAHRATSLGLVGMQERAQELGGRVTFRRAMPSGCIVRVVVPLSRAQRDT